MESPTVTAADIARLAGVGRAAVSNWRKRHPDFPAPVGGTANSPEFELTQVEGWLREQGKLPEASAADRLARRLASAGDAQIDLLVAVGEHLLHPGSTPTDDLLRDAAEVAAQCGAAETYDELLRQFADTPSGRPRATVDDLSKLMVDLAGADRRTVLDPACGAGRILRAAARAGATAICGQEIEAPTARVAQIWLALHQTTGEVRIGDSLRHDAYADTTVDAVVCGTPIGLTNWGQEELGYDPRWVYGVPPRTEPELAWVQHALAHLREGGSAVMLMPPAAASRRAGRRIRAELLRRGALRAVVALPARAAATHAVPLHLWVLRRPAPETAAPAQLLLIDVAAAGPDLAAAYARTVETYRRFVAWPGESIEEPDFARTLPIIELLDDEVDLTPARRQPVAHADVAGEQVGRTRERLAALLAELPALLPEVTAGADTTTAPPTTSVADLARAGALQLLGPVRAASSSSAAEPEAGGPVMTAEDIVRNRPPSGRDDGLTPRILLEAGDVLVPMIAPRLTARVVDEPGGALLGRHIYLLRPNPAALDPWFLAGQVRTTDNERQASSLSGTLRFDIRRAQVARVPVGEQRELGEAFCRLDAFESAIRQASSLGEELAQATADGLARGVLKPGSGRPGR
ncbi:N-6 DNA methylase [Plantactinospora siamensis]|uniref:N-6 DNA methylase n=1 Tax=Plantactinospora siamensis TaxID=555372 RepID=A0ABV6P1L7_9ACTN